MEFDPDSPQRVFASRHNLSSPNMHLLCLFCLIFSIGVLAQSVLPLNCMSSFFDNASGKDLRVRTD